jgi:outer membrane protein assembly factor BamA
MHITRWFTARWGTLAVGLIIGLCWWQQPVLAQNAPDAPAVEYALVDSISVSGNRRTRPSYMLRELEFQVGDSLPVAQLGPILERNGLRLMNLSIFTSATINVKHWGPGNRLKLHITVTESWYFYPVPVFELADRNFNVWWTEFNRSLDRVNYGLDLAQLNLTGRADVFKIRGIFGYTNRYGFSYDCPGINKKQTLGLETGFSFSRNRELAYRTVGNRLLFRNDPNAWQIERLQAHVRMIWRPKLFGFHAATLEFRRHTIADTIARKINPDYFLNGRTRQQVLSIGYNFAFDNVDIRPYPLKGWLINLELRQNGLLPTDDLFLFQAKVDVRKFTPLTNKVSTAVAAKVRTTLPRRKPPYANNTNLGYGGDLVRGFEYFVVDGLDFGLLRASINYEWMNRTFNLGRFMPLKSYKKLPIKAYFALHSDLGYANDPYYAAENPFSNRLLRGHGAGIDFLVYYDKTAQFQWFWNPLSRQGIFVLNISSGL